MSPEEVLRTEYEKYLAGYHGMSPPLEFHNWATQSRIPLEIKLDPITSKKQSHDPVNHPTHYTNHPSGIECIQITRHMNFNLGNAIKYLWRANEKGKTIEDLKKARWYIDDEIRRLEELK